MRSPRPAVDLMSCLCRPVPKASIRLIATVPQPIPKIVRKVRSFSALRSRASCLRTSFMCVGVGSREWGVGVESVRCGFFSDTPPPPPYSPLRNLLRRSFDQLLSLRQTRDHFDIQPVRDAGLDVDFLRIL